MITWIFGEPSFALTVMLSMVVIFLGPVLMRRR